jgi:uncharacterized protein
LLTRALAANQRLVTSNHVIGETYTLLRMRLGHPAATEFLARTRASERTTRVFISQTWEDEAEGILGQFSDQDFSFVDATSFVAMRKLELRTAFAFDHHFLVAGFLLLADEA